MKTNEMQKKAPPKRGVQKRRHEAMLKIIGLLNWTEEKYCEYQFEQGIRFLDHYIGEDTPYGELLRHSRIFWNWWKNQWYLRDLDFIRRFKLIERCVKPTFCYVTLNRGHALAKNDIHPNRAVLDLSYQEMVKEFIEDESKES